MRKRSNIKKPEFTYLVLRLRGVNIDTIRDINSYLLENDNVLEMNSEEYATGYITDWYRDSLEHYTAIKLYSVSADYNMNIIKDFIYDHLYDDDTVERSYMKPLDKLEISIGGSYEIKKGVGRYLSNMEEYGGVIVFEDDED